MDQRRYRLTDEKREDPSPGKQTAVQNALLRADISKGACPGIEQAFSVYYSWMAPTESTDKPTKSPFSTPGNWTRRNEV
jgi:hypothetical protein